MPAWSVVSTVRDFVLARQSKCVRQALDRVISRFTCIAHHSDNQGVIHGQNGGSSGPSIDLREKKARIEQRLHSRYPIALELQYKLLDGRRVGRLGVGRTVNISSAGVLFEADGPLSGDRIELGINWPFLLDGVTRLKLIMSGQIVRTDPKSSAVKVEHHEFRTAGRSL